MLSLHQILSDAEPWLREYGYPALAFAVGIEGVGVPAPGETLLIGASLLAGEGQLSFPVVFLTAWLAAVAGDNLGYWVGRAGGRRLLEKLRVVPAHLQRLDQFYRRFGVWLVLLSRFFDGSRQLDGIVAGSARMPWPRFLLFDGIGSLGWVAVWGWGVYLLGRHESGLHRMLHAINPWVAGVAIGAAGLLIAVLVWGRVRRRTESSGIDTQRDSVDGGR